MWVEKKNFWIVWIDDSCNAEQRCGVWSKRMWKNKTLIITLRHQNSWHVTSRLKFPAKTRNNFLTSSYYSLADPLLLSKLGEVLKRWCFQLGSTVVHLKSDEVIKCGYCTGVVQILVFQVRALIQFSFIINLVGKVCHGGLNKRSSPFELPGGWVT